RGRGAAPHARREEHPERRRAAEADHAERGGRDARHEDRAATEAVAHVAPERHEEELHERVARAEQRGREVARTEAPRDAGKIRHDEPEPEEVEKDREDDRSERGLAHGFRGPVTSSTGAAPPDGRDRSVSCDDEPRRLCASPPRVKEALDVAL